MISNLAMSTVEPIMGDIKVLPKRRKQDIRILRSKSSDRDSVIDAIKGAITKDHDFTQGIDRISESFFVSSRTLSRRLKKLDLTYREIVCAARLDEATRLLMETNSSISEIAMRVGYRHSSNFCKAFKSWSGLTPARYRRTKRSYDATTILEDKLSKFSSNA